MEINIGENFKITTDPYNFIIHERYEKVDKETKEKTGEFDFKSLGFYPSLESSCNGIIKRAVITSGVKTVEELKELIVNTKNDILEAVKEIKLNEVENNEENNVNS